MIRLLSSLLPVPPVPPVSENVLKPDSVEQGLATQVRFRLGSYSASRFSGAPVLPKLLMRVNSLGVSFARARVPVRHHTKPDALAGVRGCSIVGTTLASTV